MLEAASDSCQEAWSCPNLAAGLLLVLGFTSAWKFSLSLKNFTDKSGVHNYTSRLSFF